MADYPLADHEPIYVVGYPRSGNTWLSRLLGDVLDSPVAGARNDQPLGKEGMDRTGRFVIRQAHLKPIDEDRDELVPTPYLISKPRLEKGRPRIVIVYRDPRDVAVSVWKYWQRPKLMNGITAIGEGHHPVQVHGPIQNFYADWRDWPECKAVWVRYETMHMRQAEALHDILGAMGIDPAVNIYEAWDRQAFNSRKESITDDLPYGETIQNRHLRKGIVGDWKQHFTRADAEMAQRLFGKMMQWLGYIKDDMWWHEVPVFV